MSKFWHVLRSKPNKEEFLARQLEFRNVEFYYPQISVHPVNPRSRKIKPYFPSYLFVNTDLAINNYVSFERIPGAIGFVFIGGEVAFIPEKVLQAIRFKVDEVKSYRGDLFDTLKKGDPIKIHCGPFEGYDAIFDTRITGTERVKVLLTMLQGRKLKVELPAGYVSLEKAPSIYR